MELIENLLAFLEPYGHYSYLVLFLGLIACAFGFPMPEDIIIVTSGILAQREILNLYTIFIVLFFGIIIGDGMIYAVGRYNQEAIQKNRFFRKIVTEKRSEKVRIGFEKYGDALIFIARFLPGVRTAVFFSAGIYRVSARKFFVLNGLAALISIPIWLLIGYWFGSKLEIVVAYIDQVKHYLIVVVVAAILAFILRYLASNKKEPS